MNIRQYPLPTQVIAKDTWIVVQQRTKQIRAITIEDSEIVNGKHVVKANGYDFKEKVFPVSKVVKTLSTEQVRGEAHAN